MPEETAHSAACWLVLRTLRSVREMAGNYFVDCLSNFYGML